MKKKTYKDDTDGKENRSNNELHVVFLLILLVSLSPRSLWDWKIVVRWQFRHFLVTVTMVGSPASCKSIVIKCYFFFYKKKKYIIGEVDWTIIKQMNTDSFWNC